MSSTMTTVNDIVGTSSIYTAEEADRTFVSKETHDHVIQDKDGNAISSRGVKKTLDTSIVVDRNTPWHYSCNEHEDWTSEYIQDYICRLVYDEDFNEWKWTGRTTSHDSYDSAERHAEAFVDIGETSRITIIAERGYRWEEIAAVDDIAEWARAGQEPPSPGGHPDYIEDANGNKITAAGKFTTYKEVLQWVSDRDGHESPEEIAFMDELDTKLVGWEPEVSSTGEVTNFPQLPDGWATRDAIYYRVSFIELYVNSTDIGHVLFYISHKTIPIKTEKVLVRSVNGSLADENGDVRSSNIIDSEGNMISADRTYKEASEPVTRDTPWTYSYNGISKTEEEFSGTGASITWINSAGYTPGDAWRLASDYEYVVSTDELDTDVTYEFANTGPVIEGTEPGVPVIIHATRGGNVGGKLALQSDIADWARSGQQKPSGMSFVGFALKDRGATPGDKLTIGDYTYDGSSNNQKIDIVDSDNMYVGYISTFNDGHFGEYEVVFVPAPQDYENAGKIITFQVGGCLEEDTLILMADGTSRKVRDIRAGDKVLCVNPHSLLLDEDEVAYSDGAEDKTHDVTDVWTFSDGTVLKTVLPHEFFNVRTGCMEYIADFRIGDGVRKSDGSTVELVSHEQVNGPVRHNTLFTRKWNNYFAAGILTGNRESVKWGWHWLEEHNEAK